MEVIMKHFSKLLGSFLTAAAAAAILSAGALAADVPMSRLGSSAEFFEQTYFNSDMKIAELNKSRSVKNTLVIEENETLVIPSGCKLTLKSGCDVKGTLYIENGGYLAASGGELSITGSVVNDGTVSVGAKAALSVLSGGELYTSPEGTFKSKAGSLVLDNDITAVCLGKFSISGCASEAKNVLIGNAVSAVRTHHVLTGIRTSEVVGKEDIPNLSDAGYYLEDSVPAGGEVVMLTILFDNGSALKVSFVQDKIVQIGGAEMREILMTVE